jgi:hypothetical protein
VFGIAVLVTVSIKEYHKTGAASTDLKQQVYVASQDGITG